MKYLSRLIHWIRRVREDRASRDTNLIQQYARVWRAK